MVQIVEPYGGSVFWIRPGVSARMEPKLRVLMLSGACVLDMKKEESLELTSAEPWTNSWLFDRGFGWI